MTEQDLRAQFEDAFKRFASDVGGISVRAIERPTARDVGADFLVNVDVRGVQRVLIVECKALGQPRYLRQAIEQLREYAATIPNSYPVIIAPYITDQSASLIEANKMGYFDLAGNALLDFDGVFVRVKGTSNPSPITRELKSLFEPRSSRIVRAMLTEPNREWTVQELALLKDPQPNPLADVRVSLGLAASVKRKLLDFEYAAERSRRLILTKPGDLLDEWAKKYSTRRSKRVSLYVPEYSPSVLENEFAKRFAVRDVSSTPVRPGYAFTSFSGARRIAPFVRYNSVTAYCVVPIQEIKNKLAAKEVPTGANLIVLIPYDEGVYYASRQVSGGRVVCPVQLYLDLISDKGRGEEAAQAIREQELKY